MITLTNHGVFLRDGLTAVENPAIAKEEAAKNTMAYSILTAHNQSGNDEKLQIRFDAMASHDITYVGIIQTARASGLRSFPVPYVLTNCHNSLCAVGGTINEDDHLFGLSAAKKYGGIYVPAHQAVIHSYMREQMSGCGKMILGSDSHTRYGALGTMAIGEGGPELVKQLLCRTYDIDMPGVIAVNLIGSPRAGVGPQDVALAIIGATFESGFVKNKVMEFVGEGIANLPMEFRNGIDVMTTETTCLSSIWMTDERTEAYFAAHGRPEAYTKLAPNGIAYYDGMITVDLSKVESMIALPYHPSHVYKLREFLADPAEILKKEGLDHLIDKIDDNGNFHVDQGVIAGCAGGTFDNLCAAANILGNGSIGCDAFALSVYPASQPAMIALTKNGVIAELMQAGVTVRSAFCGPCFGAGDVPANGGLSIRHSTRNFPNREGSKPGAGQSAAVALMDARSIAATAKNGGILTAASELGIEDSIPAYTFDGTVYRNRVYNGYGKPDPSAELKFGPNIADWPAMTALTDDLLLRVASVITDPVTTTDELIPSGETSSYRSNPMKLAEFTLSRKDPAYVGRAKAVAELEEGRKNGSISDELYRVYGLLSGDCAVKPLHTGIGSVVCATKPGDGSAREQAASCQKVLGGFANIAAEYATKRYRSNLINWGMLPLLYEDVSVFENGEYIFIPGIRQAIADKAADIPAVVIAGEEKKHITLHLAPLTDDERQIILEGCLINYYRSQMQNK